MIHLPLLDIVIYGECKSDFFLLGRYIQLLMLTGVKDKIIVVSNFVSFSCWVSTLFPYKQGYFQFFYIHRKKFFKCCMRLLWRNLCRLIGFPLSLIQLLKRIEVAHPILIDYLFTLVFSCSTPPFCYFSNRLK